MTDQEQSGALSASDRNIRVPAQRQQNRAFLTLWSAYSTSYFTYWLIQIALPLFAAQLTRSPLLVSGVSFMLTLPTCLFGLWAGTLIDHYDRRQLLLVTVAIRCITFSLAIIATYLGYITLPFLYGIALLLGIAQTIEEPGYSAIVPQVITAEKLEHANTWLVGTQNIIELFASPFGSGLASIGMMFTAICGEGCSLLTLLTLWFLRGTFRPHNEGKNAVLSGIHDGIRYLWQKQILRTIAWMAALINACWGAYLTLLVLYAVSPGPIGLSTFDYGILVMSTSLGGTIGSFLTIRVQRRFGNAWTIGFNILGHTIMFAAPALSHNVWLVGGAALFGSIGGPMWTIAVATYQGRTIPTFLQGRVIAAYRLLGIGAAAIGPLAGGLCAQLFGLRPTFAICSGLTLLMLIPFFNVVIKQFTD